MTVFSFLFHPVQNFLSLFPGFFIHAGLCNLCFKFTYIRYILRMHLIQLLLQQFDLFFNRRFPVCLFMNLFLCFFSFFAYMEYLHKFINSFLNFFASFSSGICLYDTIFLFPCDIKIRRKCTSYFFYILPVQNHPTGPDSPWESFDETKDILFHLFKQCFLFFFRKIVYIRKNRSICSNHTIFSHLSIRNLYPFSHFDTYISFFIYAVDGANHTNGIKIIRCHLLLFFFFHYK